MAAAVEFPSVKYCFLFAVLLSLCVKGGARRSLSKEEVDEDSEIEKQLRILNKPPIKTIHTEWGDILDCIDINKQPALDHPLLKDHKIQMRPSSSVKDGEKSSSTPSNYQPSTFKIPSESCPKGTVPIRRTSKEDLIRAKSLQSTTLDKSKYRFAGQRLTGLTYNIPGETYHGVSAVLNVYNPALTSDDQFSSAEIAIENGPDDQINGIRVGWTVNPQLFGDNHTRLFTLWTTDSYQKTGCYNIQCPGFVQVDQQIGPGSQSAQTSVYKGVQYKERYLIFQDFKTGDWWLTIHENKDGDKEINVGYWPKALFGNLNGGRVYWGGHVKGSASGVFPEMGNGHVPTAESERDYTLACYYKHMKYLDSNNTLLNPRQYYITGLKECAENYRIEYYGFQQGDFGHTFQFGGPGGFECII